MLTAKGAHEPEIWKIVSLPLMCKCFGKAALLPDHSGKGETSLMGRAPGKLQRITEKSMCLYLLFCPAAWFSFSSMHVHQAGAVRL